MRAPFRILKRRICVVEILWHGRGGQGAFTAAKLLGAAYCTQDGHYALAFPSFGPERRGAPMRAFTKLSRERIGNRSALSVADFVIYLDETLLPENPFGELKEGGAVLVNSARTFDDPRIVSVDADGISSSILGRAIPNTVLLGALSVLSEDVREEDLLQAIRGYMPPRLHQKNFDVVEAAVKAMEGGR